MALTEQQAKQIEYNSISHSLVLDTMINKPEILHIVREWQATRKYSEQLWQKMYKIGKDYKTFNQAYRESELYQEYDHLFKASIDELNDLRAKANEILEETNNYIFGKILNLHNKQRSI